MPTVISTNRYDCELSCLRARFTHGSRWFATNAIRNRAAFG